MVERVELDKLVRISVQLSLVAVTTTHAKKQATQIVKKSSRFIEILLC
jgi:hypothetical protein